jgi:ABC-type Na+ efflux pump permease subunit
MVPPKISNPETSLNLENNLLIMKTVTSILLISLLLLLAGQASASYWFKVTDISPITVMPNGEANFTVSVKGLGSQGGYVQLIFLNKTQGIDTSCERLIKYVFPTGTTKYNCSVKSADIPPGNYSFVVDVAAKGAPSGKKTAYVNVVAAGNGAAIESQMDQMNQNASENQSPSIQEPEEIDVNQTNPGASGPVARETPALGVVPAVLALLLITRRMRR